MATKTTTFGEQISKEFQNLRIGLGPFSKKRKLATFLIMDCQIFLSKSTFLVCLFTDQVSVPQSSQSEQAKQSVVFTEQSEAGQGGEPSVSRL
jgi:hypothetical protein